MQRVDAESNVALKTHLGSLAGLRKGNVLADAGEERVLLHLCITLRLRLGRPGAGAVLQNSKIVMAPQQPGLLRPILSVAILCPHFRNR